MRENGVLTWLISDHLGSTNITANADGTLLSTVKYSAFGEIRAASGNTSSDYLYTGQRSEAEIGLYYYGARWYDPTLGHFIQADTIVPQPGNPMAWDRYAYTLNNPLRYVDPSGHAFKNEDWGYTPGCGVGECYITLLGSTPSLPLVPTQYQSLGENANNSSCGGCSMEPGVNTAPDVTTPGLTIKESRGPDPLSGIAGAAGVANDLLIFIQNIVAANTKSTINVFVFYKIEDNGYQVKSIDIQNPNQNPITVTVVDVNVTTYQTEGVVPVVLQTNYTIIPRDSIYPTNGYYSGVGIAYSNSTTTIPLLPSRNPINPNNYFLYNQGLLMSLYLVDTLTGMDYIPVNGYIP